MLLRLCDCPAMLCLARSDKGLGFCVWNCSPFSLLWFVRSPFTPPLHLSTFSLSVSHWSSYTASISPVTSLSLQNLINKSSVTDELHFFSPQNNTKTHFVLCQLYPTENLHHGRHAAPCLYRASRQSHAGLVSLLFVYSMYKY